MSQHHLQGGGRDVTPRRRLVAMATAGVLTLVVGLSACGDDDDETAIGGDASTPIETTIAAGDITEPPTESVVSTVPDTGVTSTPDDTTVAEPAVGTATATDAAEGTDDAPATTGPDEGTSATEAAADPATTAAAGTTDATGDTTAGTESDEPAESGPTTTGPECEFVENASYPLERCNTGPAIAVLQQSLQAAGFTEILVDGFFGDETLFAVRSFQEDEGLTVDGLVDAETWAALDPQGVGNDDNDNGVIDPNEVDLG